MTTLRTTQLDCLPPVSGLLSTLSLRRLPSWVFAFTDRHCSGRHNDVDKGVSPMPVYGVLLAPADLDAMVAYLVSLRGERK